MSEKFPNAVRSLGAFVVAQCQRAQVYLARNGKRIRAGIPNFIPILKWLPAYPKAQLQFDLIAGLTVWGVGIPTAMAYAELAGVPPQAGLYAACAAMFGYAIFGASRHIKVTTSSTMAVMSAAVIAPLAASDATRFWILTSGLAFVVGIMLLMAGLIKLGFIADFLSKPVVTGFVFGLAISIAVGQLPKLFGLASGSGNVFQQLFQLLTRLPLTNVSTLAVGGGAILLISVLRRTVPQIPGGLAALAGGILVSALLNLSARHVSIVGEIPTGLPSFGIPDVGLFDLAYLIAGAGGIVFLAVGESLGNARAFAAKHHYAINADQELTAMGMANLASSVSQGMTVDASLSQSATSEAAGSRTQLSGIVAAGLVLLTLLLLAGLFAPLPKAVLAAIVIVSVISLMDVSELRRYYAAR